MPGATVNPLPLLRKQMEGLPASQIGRDWYNLSVATLSNDRRLPGLGGPYALQQNVLTSIPV